jgi:hypothetical protein
MNKAFENHDKTNIEKPKNILEVLIDHLNETHIYPTDVPDTLFDLIATSATPDISQVEMVKIISRVNLWLLQKIKGYRINNEIFAINSRIIIGYVASLNLVFPFYDTANFINTLKSQNLFHGVCKYSSRGQKIDCQECSDWFIDKITYKLGFINYGRTEEMEKITNTINNMLESRALQRQIEILYYSEILPDKEDGEF